MTRARVRVREACRAGRGGGLQRAALRQGTDGPGSQSRAAVQTSPDR
jgi:hypothetical protein